MREVKSCEGLRAVCGSGGGLCIGMACPWCAQPRRPLHWKRLEGRSRGMRSGGGHLGGVEVVRGARLDKRPAVNVTDHGARR
eukprot:7046794-Prymnesium_polylepis.2